MVISLLNNSILEFLTKKEEEVKEKKIFDFRDSVKKSIDYTNQELDVIVEEASTENEKRKSRLLSLRQRKSLLANIEPDKPIEFEVPIELKIKRCTKKTETSKKLELKFKCQSSQIIKEEKKNADMESLSEIIEGLNHDKDLNSVVSVVNEVLARDNKKLFNIDDLDIYLSAKELDKFSQAKKMMDNFYVRINYSLQGKLG